MKVLTFYFFAFFLCYADIRAGNINVSTNSIKQDSFIYYAHNFKTDGLILRANPGLNAVIIDTLNYNDSIAIISDTIGSMMFGDLKSGWAKVKFKKTIAYCPNIFLCRMPLPSKKEIGILSLETYVEKYVSKKTVDYKADSKPDHFAQKLLFKNFDITTLFCFFHYLGFLDVNTPFPIYCINYTAKTSSYTTLNVKSDGDTKKTMTTLSLEYWYGNTETLFEFKELSNGVAVKIVYNYGQ